MKYGVKLISYRGDAASQWQQMDMWCWDARARIETDDFEEANKIADEYRDRNPNGIYAVKPIEEEQC